MVKNFLRLFKEKPKEAEAAPKKGDGPQPVEIVLVTEPAGSSGTQIWSGYIQEDYLDNMNGTERADIFDKMRRGDPNIKMLLNAVKGPVRSAVFEVEAGEDTDQGKKDAEFISHVLFNDMNKPWSKFLDEALTKVEFGYSLFEVIHKAVVGNKKYGSYNGIKLFAWRSPRTIDTWQVDPKTEELLSVTQYAYGDLIRHVKIPAQNLILFNIDQEGANFEGISMIRPCYGNWFRKNLYLKLNAAGIEKFAIPTPTAKIPNGLQGSEQYSKLITALEKYTSHQKNYLTYPEGWEVDISPKGNYDPAKVEASIDAEDRRMTKAFLANFLELGMNSVGTQALSSDLSSFFRGALDYIAKDITEKITIQVIPNLIRMNFGERDVYPKLKHSGISDKAGMELANIFTALVGSRVLIPDDVLEDNVRKRYALPPRSKEGQRQAMPSVPGEDEEENEFVERIRALHERRTWRNRR